MSIVPLFMDLLDDPLDDILLRPAYSCDYHPLYHNPYGRRHPIQRHRRRGHGARDQTVSRAHVGKEGFQVSLDVVHFQPNEITVKTVDNSIVVEGKHEEKEDEHGHIYRHFIRRYELPQECDVKDVVSTLSSDGILTLKAPTKSKSESNEKIIQIQHTGPARLSVKDNTKEDKKSEEKMTE